MDKTSRKNEGITARKNKLKWKKHGKNNIENKSKKHELEKPGIKKKLEDALPSNWAKYEIKDESDDEVDGAVNFEMLLDKPLSENSYFKFKNEQEWSNNVELHSQFSKYFTLDLKLLSEGIGCIPFTQRHDYDDPVFKILDEDTSKKISKYETFLKKKYPAKNTKLNIKTEVTIGDTNDKNDMEDVIKGIDINSEVKYDKLEREVKDDKKDEVKKIGSMELLNNVKDKRVLNVKKSENKKSDEDLEKLLNLKITDEDNTSDIVLTEDPLMAATNVSKNVTTNTPEDLEQWLDDILDD